MASDKSIRIQIGKRVAERRAELGMTQQQLAEALRVTQPKISAIEAGAAGLSLDRLYKLAEALSCTPADLTASS
jgi:transcriptional regulator with XRE-family HTH domain